MSDFLSLIETLRAEQASVEKLFGGEGQGVRTGRRQSSPQYLARLAETAEFMADIYSGDRPVHHLREVMSTSDFPLLFADVIDRQVLAAYREYPSEWRQYVSVKGVPDFRTVKRFPPPLGAESELSAVPELADYPIAALVDSTPYTYHVAKYGRTFGISWEALINDDLDQLKDTPQRFARAARRTEARFVTNLFVDTSGPHASLYTNGNANIMSLAAGAALANPVLSIAALQDAMKMMAAQTATIDGTTEPIFIEAYHLVIPPTLEIVAQNILNALQVWGNTGGGGDAVQTIVAQNWMRGRVVLHVDPYIPIIATSNGNTSWFLFAQPDDRPALEVGFLRGHEMPEIFIKEPNARRVGGGVNPMDGDFMTDSIEYKVRHVIGGSRMDPKMTLASNGSSA